MRQVLAISLFLSSQILWAQSSRVLEYVDTETERREQQQIFERWAAQPTVQKEARERAAADAQVREFSDKARRFVELWHSFATELDGKGTFNAKLAKQVSKAFHDLEKTDGWPVGRSK